MNIGRRAFLYVLASVGAGALLPRPSFGGVPSIAPVEHLTALPLPARLLSLTVVSADTAGPLMLDRGDAASTLLAYGMGPNTAFSWNATAGNELVCSAEHPLRLTAPDGALAVQAVFEVGGRRFVYSPEHGMVPLERGGPEVPAVEFVLAERAVAQA